MITTLALSFQHLLIVVIIFVILGLPIYFIIKALKSSKKKEQLLSQIEINNLGSEEPPRREIAEEILKKLEKYGSISQKLNLLIYISVLLMLAFLSLLSSSKNIQGNSGVAEMFGAVIGAIIGFIILAALFTLMFNPIRRLYKRYLLFLTGSIDHIAFNKYKNSNKVWTIVFSIISVLLVNSIGMIISPIYSIFGIIVFILLMLPHYIFSSILKKVSTK